MMLCALLFVLATPFQTTETTPPDTAEQSGAAVDETSDRAAAIDAILNEIGAKNGPMLGSLGPMAEIDVPEGFLFCDATGTRKYLELNQNPTDGSELGMLMPDPRNGDGAWFVCFAFADAGHIEDKDHDLDADDLLDTLKQGNEHGNEERKRRGWDTLELVGWEKAPFYESKTNNLTWATRYKSGDHEGVNWSTRLLGRRGYMNVDLVISPEELATALPRFESLMSGFRYREGHRYAEFRAGDKVAEYGLAALVAGGAGVVAAKTGLLAKFWKLIVAGIVALSAAIKGVWRKLRGAPSETSSDSAGGG